MKKAIFGFILCLFSIASFAQNITVQGVVVSEIDGMPVIGAAVIPTDYLSEGTATDLDGKFTLNVPSNPRQRPPSTSRKLVPREC